MRRDSSESGAGGAMYVVYVGAAACVCRENAVTARDGASSVAPVSNVSLRWSLHSLAGGASSAPSAATAAAVSVVATGGGGAVVWCNYNGAHKRTRTCTHESADARGENPNTRAKDDLRPTGCAAYPPAVRPSVRPPTPPVRGIMYGGGAGRCRTHVDDVYLRRPSSLKLKKQRASPPRPTRRDYRRKDTVEDTVNILRYCA